MHMRKSRVDFTVNIGEGPHLKIKKLDSYVYKICCGDRFGSLLILG